MGCYCDDGPVMDHSIAEIEMRADSMQGTARGDSRAYLMENVLLAMCGLCECYWPSCSSRRMMEPGPMRLEELRSLRDTRKGESRKVCWL